MAVNNQLVVSFFCVFAFVTLIEAARGEISRREIRSPVEVDCGVLSTSQDGSLPWHAAIYKVSTLNQPLCGGTLVGPKTVITVAHCVSSSGGKVEPASNYAVVLGKVLKPWNFIIDSRQQISNVSKIDISPTFRGIATRFQSDIAVLTLVNQIVFTQHVQPVCLNLNSNSALQRNDVGKIAGFGGVQNSKLVTFDLPYLPTPECLTAVGPGLASYITADKFCAGLGNGTSLCPGDSGASISFPQIDQGFQRYYLKGVASTSKKSLEDAICPNRHPIFFTDITKHKEFLQKILQGDLIKVIRKNEGEPL